MSTCTKAWRFPSDPLAFDASYVVGTEVMTVPFDGVDLSNCPFKLLVSNITADPDNPTTVKPSIVTLTQPNLIANPSDSFLRSVSQPGSI